jgi:hypothetical protein
MLISRLVISGTFLADSPPLPDFLLQMAFLQKITGFREKL